MDGARVNYTQRERRIVRMEQTAAELVEAAHVLCNADNRVCWQIRNNTIALKRAARLYAHAVKMVQRD
jgi:hypothetical protein